MGIARCSFSRALRFMQGSYSHVQVGFASGIGRPCFYQRMLRPVRAAALRSPGHGPHLQARLRHGLWTRLRTHLRPELRTRLWACLRTDMWSGTRVLCSQFDLQPVRRRAQVLAQWPVLLRQ